MGTLPDGLHFNMVSLREYVDTRFEAFSLAIRTANDAMNNRLQGMNEFRESLKDQSARFATRLEIETLSKQVHTLENWRASQEGKASQSSVMWSMFLAALGVALAIAGLIISLIR